LANALNAFGLFARVNKRFHFGKAIAVRRTMSPVLMSPRKRLVRCPCRYANQRRRSATDAFILIHRRS